MVTFKKEELNFLNVFVSCIDNKKQSGNLFNIKSQDGKIYFSQIGADVLSFYEVEKEAESDINYWVDTQFIYNLVNTLNDEDSISFSNEGISLSNRGQYEAEIFEYDNPVLEEMIKYNSSEYKETVISDLKKLNKVKQFMNPDKQGLDAIGIMSGYFIGSDEKHTGIVLTENSRETTVYLNTFIINLIAKYKIEELNVKVLEEQSFYSFDFGGVKIFTPIKKYKFHPDFFEFKDKFYHEDKFIVKKAEILKALNRMKLVTVKDNKYRVFVTYDKDFVEIESKDYIAKKAKEVVDAEIDSALYSESDRNFVILSSNFMESIIKNIDSEDVIIRTKPTQKAEEIGVVTFTDVEEKTFYLHSAYTNVKVAD